MIFPKVNSIPTLVGLLAIHHASAHDPIVSPPRVSLASLLNANDDAPLLLEQLTRDGFVSITDIPSFKQAKRAVMSHLHACIMDIDNESKDGNSVPTQRFQDGTVRRSFATSTSSIGGGAQPIKTLEDYEALAPKSVSCQHFRSHLSEFRSLADGAMMAFAQRLSDEMGASLSKPLLSTPAGSKDYQDIKHVVAAGEHLEHFHSYQKQGDESGETTIEFHTDQGFFIGFTPGLIVSEDVSPDRGLELSDGFHIQDSAGERFEVKFTGNDDLVFMMGDGVNQYINNKLNDGKKALRATPHALTLRTQEDTSKARVWYGRMVLPPSDAYVPSMDSTFGESRQVLMDSTTNGDGVPMGIGCSSSDMKAVIQTSRKLDGPDNDFLCAEGELFCWFRCQKLEDHGLTATSCTERNLELQCISPRGHVIPDGKKHGDYYPDCTNNTAESHPYEDYPSIEQQVEDVCTAEEWQTFASSDGYEHTKELTQPNGTDTWISWSILEDAGTGAQKIKARLTFNNVFGWLAMGFADPDGKHNGMNGGNVILARPGGEYSAATGMDMTQDGVIGMYQIDDTDSAFRHWVDTFDSDIIAEYDHDGCFTAITFESDHINGQKFNFSGTDEMIWAGNHMDHFVGYHGRLTRARFVMDWTPDMMKEDVAVMTSDDGDVAQTSVNGDVAQTSVNGDVAQTSDNGDAAHTSEDGDVVHTSEDGDAAHTSDDGHNHADGDGHDNDAVERASAGSVKSIAAVMYTVIAFTGYYL